jgi:hypothetical protein
MSKLAKKLRQISENAGQPLGFRMARQASGQQMALIVSLLRVDAGAAKQLAQAEVDAILIHSQGSEGSRTLQGVTDKSGATPWGLWPEAASEECLKQLKEAGGDFLVIEAATASATLLQEEDVCKVLRVDLPQDESLAGTIADLPVDVVLLEVKSEGSVLTVCDVMYCQWLVGLVDKPVLAAVQGELSEKEIQSLWEAGVRGLVVEFGEGQSQESVARLSQAIRALHPEARRRAGRKPVVPRLSHADEERED